MYLQPGEAHFSETPVRVVTVLGSCIAVTMFSARLKAGGICHALLPQCRREPCVAGCDEIYRYVGCSIKGMLAWFAGKGVYPGDLEVKLFGGSDILLMDPQRDYVSVGKQNIEFAAQGLLREGLSPNSSHVGGIGGRKIIFFTHTGEVLMQRIGKIALMKGGSWRP